MTREFEYSLTEADLVSAFRLMGRRKGSRRIVPLLWIGVAVCVVALTFLIGTPERLFANPLLTGLAGAAVILFLILVMVLLAVPSMRRRAARSTLADNPNFEGPVQLALDERTFRHGTAYAKAAYPWGKLYGWRADERITIVQPAPQLFFVIPMQVLDEPARALLQAGLAQSRQGRLDV